ncbi:D-alanyl-D-alanine carboxypeptidase family protein [Nitrosomonas sp. Nm166]|uniref:D-alanyl-D-alanine carboxypeptidase family protein n=1 Tax=Nitrosomonas sp. Nm166 TaxID=1881054 RepID=UPI0008F22268|nr:D-alanyl-D-alanine carboxypeptidase family protein [Nitrosomonas sp. Nm166]SFE42634.1 D-alanyl-D-alanine carboxypeptidase [Nitrosomonas sp. Nm166]
MMALKRISKEGFLVLAVMSFFFLANPTQANPLHASIVIDANTGAVLHQSHADASRYPASLTKMMTLYMLFEALEQRKMTLDTRMPVSARAASMPSTHINLQASDTISVRDAIPALIVRSANDVAAVIAEALGNTEANFGRLMTDKARRLGMHSTTFRNASGLPNNEQKTTARDLATLSSRLMKDFPQYYHYFSTRSFSYKGVTYHSHNRMVRNTHGVDGLKTGFIRASGFNVATSAKRGDRRVIAVVMGGQTAASRDQRMAQLLNRSFARGSVTQVAKNTDNNPGAPVVTQKASASTPASKPAPGLKKMPEPVVIAKAVQPETRAEPKKMAATNSKSWEVQIGSYLAHDRAQAQAQAATRWIPGAVVITEVEISNRKLYRARLVGLHEKQARTACQSLSRQGMECLVVRSQG